MSESHQFLVPDYFPDFKCKMGACRHTCCEGWSISVSMNDYFHLLSVPCSPELRRRLDTSLHICDNPTPDRYAQLCPRYDGNCSMRYPDGRCWLQMELGEEALSRVCRLYPRGIRAEGGYECSCANSCEAVLEAFLYRKEPLTFRTVPLTLEIPEVARRRHHFETGNREQKIRMYLIDILQDRSQDMARRLLTLGGTLRLLNDYVQKGALDRIDLLLSRSPRSYSLPVGELTDGHLVHGLEIAEGLLEQVDEKFRRIQEYGQATLNWFKSAPPLEQYQSAKAHFDNVFPTNPTFFEHILVNHFFFRQIPFQDRPLDFFDGFLGLCATYAFLRFLCMGWMASRQSADDLMDVLAAAFRLIDHTSFDMYGALLLKEKHVDDPQSVYDLIRL